MKLSIRFLPIAAVLAAIFAALPFGTHGFEYMFLVPPQLQDLIPDKCKADDESEFQQALSCAFERIADGCIGIIGALPDFQTLPSLENITTCEHIVEPFCKIANTCKNCTLLFDDLIRCIFLKDEAVNDTFVEFFWNETDDMIYENLFDETEDDNTTLATISFPELLSSCALNCTDETVNVTEAPAP